MKRVFIIHGWGGSPREKMNEWLKRELQKRKYEVIVPEMPDTDEPKIKNWVEKIRKIVKNPDKNTYFIGHSVGCQGILRYLETLDLKTQIGGAVLIAPWIKLDEETIKEEGEESIRISKPWVETPIDWKKVKLHTNKFICILSDNDPYVPLSNGDFFKEKLGAEIIMEKNKGHFTEGDGVKKNQTALDKLIEISY